MFDQSPSQHNGNHAFQIEYLRASYDDINRGPAEDGQSYDHLSRSQESLDANHLYDNNAYDDFDECETTDI